MLLLTALALLGAVVGLALLLAGEVKENRDAKRLDALIREAADSLVQEPERLIQTLRALRASEDVQEELQALVHRLEPQFPGCTIEVNLLGTDEQCNVYSGGTIPVGISVCKFTALFGATLRIENAKKVNFLDGNPLLAHAESYLGHPLYVEGIKVGACCVHNPRPRNWTQEDEKCIFSLSTRVSVLLEKHLEVIVTD